MRFRSWLLVLSCAVLTSAPSAQQAAPAELSWVAGDLPPFAWQAAEGPRGYAHELALAMAQRLGRKGGVTYYPWARSLKITEGGDRYGIFPLARTPDREQRFRWLVHLDTVEYVFVGLAAGQRLSLEQLRPLPVGVLRGSPLVAVLKAQRFENIVEATNYRDLLKLLKLHAIQAIYAARPMLNASMVEAGYAPEGHQEHLSFGQAGVYMGASLRLSDTEAERWQQAYQQLLDDGSVARLRARYLQR